MNSQQSADSNAKVFKNKMSSEQNHRDRLGFWGQDSEVAGAFSGLERLRLSRFNKVCEIYDYYRITHYILYICTSIALVSNFNKFHQNSRNFDL